MLSRLNLPLISGKNIFILFSLMIAAITIADSTMGYVAPLLIEQLTSGHDAILGVILATSSMAGIVMDFSFARMFPKKDSWFFLRILFIFMFFFPLPFLLFRSVIASIFGMIAWGIYFEAMIFANFHAIHEQVKVSEHAWAWGISGILRTVGWVVGPLIASVLWDVGPTMPVRFAIFSYAAGIILFALLALVLHKAKKVSRDESEFVMAHRSFGTEISIWKTYGKTLWPLLVFTLLYFFIESAFFSIGPIFGEQLKGIHPLGGAFVSIYSVPGLFVGFLLTMLSKPFGKKRLSFIGGIIAGVGFIAMGLTHSIFLILGLTLVAAIGMCVWQPALDAVYQDYVGRAKGFGNDLIGLTAMAGSLSYILGPIMNGVLSENIGEQNVFMFWGIVALIYSTLLFFIVKRKIHLPQAEVAQVYEQGM
jgi:MFS family permease